MKNKLFIFLILGTLLLSVCSNNPIDENGNGISVEMGKSLNIKNVGFILYYDLKEEYGGNGINGDGSAFKKGDIVWTDISIPKDKNSFKLAITYSESTDNSNFKTTSKIDITGAKKWVKLKLTDEYKLEIIDME